VRGGKESQRKREGERERGRERERERDERRSRERERERERVGWEDRMKKNRLQWNASCACYLIKLDSIVQHSIRTTQQNPHSSSIKIVPTMI